MRSFTWYLLHLTYHLKIVEAACYVQRTTEGNYTVRDMPSGLELNLQVRAPVDSASDVQPEVALEGAQSEPITELNHDHVPAPLPPVTDAHICTIWVGYAVRRCAQDYRTTES